MIRTALVAVLSNGGLAPRATGFRDCPKDYLLLGADQSRQRLAIDPQCFRRARLVPTQLAQRPVRVTTIELVERGAIGQDRIRHPLARERTEVGGRGRWRACLPPPRRPPPPPSSPPPPPPPRGGLRGGGFFPPRIQRER